MAYFFSSDSMRFFDSKVYPGVYGGRYFVTSEKPENGVRRFKIREAEDSGRVKTVGQDYSSLEGARLAARLLGGRQANPTLPRNKWVAAQIRVTSSGKIQAKVPASALRSGTSRKSHNPRKRTTRDYWSIEGNYGYGWEEVTAEDTWKGARARLKEYRENEHGVSFRVRRRREKIEATTNPRRRRSR
jgi:hypothetical protein